MYSIKELAINLDKKIEGLGINPKFKENPAYEMVILEINTLLAQMHIGLEEEINVVNEANGNISFSITNSEGEKYSMIILCTSNDSFRCIATFENRPAMNLSGQRIREKTTIEHVATLDSHNFMTLNTNGSVIVSNSYDYNKCDNYTWTVRKYYTDKGVMRDREYKNYSMKELTESFDSAKINSCLHIPRNAYNGPYTDAYERRELLVRDKFDTAKVYIEDKSESIRYEATRELSGENGYQEMNLPGGYDMYPKNIYIGSLTEDEIKNKLEEENPEVAEGLKPFIVGREEYIYDSSTDQNFIYEGIENLQSMTR